MIDSFASSDIAPHRFEISEVTRQQAFQGIVDCELSPGGNLQTDEEIEIAIRKLATTGHHPVSTCRMGPDHDVGAVVDHQLRVRGAEGLRIVDASIYPDQISGNTGAPTMMIAEKAADMILDKPALPAEDPRDSIREKEKAIA